jgi:hypothetical protein
MKLSGEVDPNKVEKGPSRDKKKEGKRKGRREEKKREEKRTHNLSPNQIPQPKTIPHFNLIPLCQSNICQSNDSSEIFIGFWDWFAI